MKKLILLSFLIGWTMSAAGFDGYTGASVQAASIEKADAFGDIFADSTLRVDYIFGGGPGGTHVMLDRQCKSEGWYGRRGHLDEAACKGNGTIFVTDAQTGDTLYVQTFSSLFQEWINTPEAETVNRSFENSFLVPLPKGEANISLELRDNRHQPIAKATHRYRPDDVLVAVKGGASYPYEYVHRGGDPKKTIDVAMLSEGYTAQEMDSFLVHAKRFADEMLSYEPYASNKDKFNFIAVMVPSKESGVSIPKKGEWKDTAFGSHFSTFYSDRYLTTPNVRQLHDALTGIPYEHIMILVNTDEYGGGGIYNSYHIASSLNKYTLPVTVHEFGHSFGGLADEYFYEGEEDSTYPTDIEPWEANITTLVDFDSKWSRMMDKDTPIPTPWDHKAASRGESIKQKSSGGADTEKVGVYEGGGYRTKGVYRPAITCRMRDNYHPSFCPVCEAALTRIIKFYTE